MLRERRQFLPHRPLGEFEFDERRHDLDAGIADEDIKGSECLDDLGRSIVHLLLICDIHRDAESTLAGGIDLSRSGIGCLLPGTISRTGNSAKGAKG
jgi:hypothetical protein